MEYKELQLLQELPLDIKIGKSRNRIMEFVRMMGGHDAVYISFSGGKDSTVLLHLVRSIYPNMEAVFSNTGLEFPEIVDFVKKQENIKIVKPKKSFKQVIEEQGYPITNKKTARMISDCQNPSDRNQKSRKLYLSRYTLDKDGNQTEKPNNSFRIADKWLYLIDAPFKVSHRCCDILKKNPMRDFEKESGKRPIIGTMAEESKMREASYLKTGCNSFREGKEVSVPISFWTEQDILQYIKKFGLEYSNIYGEILEDETGKLFLTGERRTGCIFCGFCRNEKALSERYLRLEKTHPQLHKYCMETLGFDKVCEYMDVKYKEKDEKDIDTTLE